MEYILLGLLSLRPMTLYDLNKTLKKNISLFYSASFGSINTTLSKLLTKGWAIAEEKVEGGRNKKIFSLTSAGQQAFQSWLGSPMEVEKFKDAPLARFYFLGLLPEPESRRQVLESHLENLRQTQAALETLYQQNTAVQVLPEQQAIYEYQLLTLKYGLDFYTFNIAWYENLLKNK